MPTQPPSASRRGLTMFLLYTVLYIGFIALNVLRPDIMAERVHDTVTVAIAYGMVLIFAAALLALLYVRGRHAE